MANISEIAGQLKDALEHSQQAHKALEGAKAALAPLEEQAEQADIAVNNLMRQYQQLTSDVAPVARRRGKAGTRPARTPESLIQATTTRTLGMAKKAGTKKAVAVLQTVERIKKLATKYKIQFTDAMQAEIDSKAKAAWKK